jgi:hypothetical protein
MIGLKCPVEALPVIDYLSPQRPQDGGGEIVVRSVLQWGPNAEGIPRYFDVFGCRCDAQIMARLALRL